MSYSKDTVVYAAASTVPPEQQDETWVEEVTLNPYPPKTRVLRNKVPEAFMHIPEARDLTWEDDFFEDEDDVIAVFDFDYDKMEEFYTSLGWVSLAATLLYPPVFGLALVCLTPCFLRSNVQWFSRAKHVAITPDGIRYVENRRRSCWGMDCCDQGKNSKTVPYDKITDCDIIEPAGNQCLCCIPRVLYSVNVDTASSNQTQHELQIAGLKEPHRFKKLVWAMKRSYGSSRTNQAHNVSGVGADGNVNIEMLSILREIRDELRENNETLNALKQNGTIPTVQASLPSAADGEPSLI